MINPFEKVEIAPIPKELRETTNIVKMPYHYLFVMYSDKTTDKIKSLDPFFLIKFIEERRQEVIYYSLTSKTVDASQYDELE